MFPFFRMALGLWLYRNRPMGMFDTHVTTHVIRPFDIDMFGELNNGRTQTIYDIGRITLAVRSGFYRVLRREGWGLTVAGVSTRFRRRVRMFDRIETRARVVGWDERFIYIDHTMWRKGDCTSQVLARTAVTDRNGIVTPQRCMAALGYDGPVPQLPDWVQAWVAAEATRPWPPVRDHLILQ